MLRPRDGRSVQGWASADRMIADMDAAGIDQVWLMGEYRRDHDACVARNAQTLALMRRWPGRVQGFAIVQPLAGRAALDEAVRCLDAGMIGVGELGPYAQGYRLHHPAFLRLAELCAARGALMNLHTNEEVGRFYPGKAVTPLRDYYRLAATLPELRLILAHWGGGLLFYELMAEVRRTLRNVCYDTAASPLLFGTRDIFEAALRCVDPAKLLVASDYPLLLYPRRQVEPDFRPFAAEVEALGLPPAVHAALTGANAARLLDDARRGVSSSAPSAKPATLHAPVIDAAASVALLAEAWPATRAVFERWGIAWDDAPVPFWEPVMQAAAARGLGPDAVDRLVAELREAAGA
jgi:predicted TIM-barrel fold metal-dependent hydrolase